MKYYVSAKESHKDISHLWNNGNTYCKMLNNPKLNTDPYSIQENSPLPVCKACFNNYIKTVTQIRKETKDNNQAEPENRIEAYFDGSCIENPGTLGSWGFVICDPWIEKNDTITGKRVTNNTAEYSALLNLLKELETLKINQAHIKGDSKMVVKIVNKEWGMKKGIWNPHKNYPDLRQLAKECQSLISEYGHKLSWVPRERNKVADRLTKEAYG